MIPEELKPGDKLEAGWLNRLVREIVARTVNAGPGLLKTQTPAGTTLSLAPQRRTSGAAGADFDFPWRVSATADGAGGATLNMSPGAIIADTANGLVMHTDISLPASQRHVSSSGYVVFRWALDFSAYRVTFEASVPANTDTYNYLPVAQVTKSGNLYTVSQYLAGAFLAIATVNEEI